MVLISMKEEWRCALLTSGEQCVATSGTALMQLWSARIWDMLSLMVCIMKKKILFDVGIGERRVEVRSTKFCGSMWALEIMVAISIWE